MGIWKRERECWESWFTPEGGKRNENIDWFGAVTARVHVIRIYLKQTMERSKMSSDLNISQNVYINQKFQWNIRISVQLIFSSITLFSWSEIGWNGIARSPLQGVVWLNCSLQKFGKVKEGGYWATLIWQLKIQTAYGKFQWPTKDIYNSEVVAWIKGYPLSLHWAVPTYLLRIQIRHLVTSISLI